MTTPDPHVGADLLGPAALGLLDADGQRRVQAHLRACDACAAELAALTATVGRLAQLDGSPALLADLVADRPAPALAEGVLRRVAAERQRAQRGQRLLAAAAAVAVLLAGVLSATALSREVPAAPREPVAVRAAAGVSASAALVAHTWGVEIALAVTGLADGAPYTVEVETADGRVLPAGAFLGTGRRTLTCSLNSAVLRPDAAAFTVRDASRAEVLSARL